MEAVGWSGICVPSLPAQNSQQWGARAGWGPWQEVMGPELEQGEHKNRRLVQQAKKPSRDLHKVSVIYLRLLLGFTGTDTYKLNIRLLWKEFKNSLYKHQTHHYQLQDAVLKSALKAEWWLLSVVRQWQNRYMSTVFKL